jgi:hypothetical protein
LIKPIYNTCWWLLPSITTACELHQRPCAWHAFYPAAAAVPAAGTPEQAALVRSELLLTQRLKELSHELSDASLQQVSYCSMLKFKEHCCIGVRCHAQHISAAYVHLLTCVGAA